MESSMYVSIDKTKEKGTVSLFLSISHQQVSPCWPYESYSSPAKHTSIDSWLAGWLAPKTLCGFLHLLYIVRGDPIASIVSKEKGT